jgi:hypothetical protein
VEKSALPTVSYVLAVAPVPEIINPKMKQAATKSLPENRIDAGLVVLMIVPSVFLQEISI